MDPESKPAHVSKRCARRPGATGATAIEKGKKARRCAADGSSASKMATVECKQEPQPTDNGFGDCGVLDRCEPGWLVEDACAGGHEVCERWQRSSWGPSHCDGASQGGASGSAHSVASVDIAARARMSIKPIIVEWQDTKKRSKKSQGKGKPRNFPARPDTATDITLSTSQGRLLSSPTDPTSPASLICRRSISHHPLLHGTPLFHHPF